MPVVPEGHDAATVWVGPRVHRASPVAGKAAHAVGAMQAKQPGRQVTGLVVGPCVALPDRECESLREGVERMRGSLWRTLHWEVPAYVGQGPGKCFAPVRPEVCHQRVG